MNLIKLTRPFYRITENDIVIQKPITQEVLDSNDLKDTILDSRLNDSCGYIKVKSGMILYNYYNSKDDVKNLQQFNVEPKSLIKKTETYTVKANEYIRVPKGINKIFILENGLKILTKLQRAYNNIIIENNTLRNKDENIIYQNLYTNLLVEFNDLLSGKGGLFDRASNSNFPYSCRGVITPGPNLKVNEVCLPYSVLLKWVSKDEVRNAFNIDLDLPNKEAVRFLENKRVLLGRQPSHMKKNLMSHIIKIQYNNSDVIKINPAIVHMYDGDYDGDSFYAILILDKQSQQDLINMDVFKFIKENPKHFNPKKEFKKYKPEKWATNDFDMLNMQIAEIAKLATNGQSVSYHDCNNDGLNDGYLDNLGVNRDELKHISEGIYQEELVNGDDNNSIIGAVKSYKIIKQNVAQFGALSNAFMALAINYTWDLKEEEKKKYLDLVAEFKHILCQDGLSSKHGQNKIDINMSKVIQDAFYRTPDNKLKTKEEYINLLKQVNLSDEIINVIINLFWRDRLIGINKILNDITPTYRITRRGSDINLLENMTMMNDEKSLQARML